MSCKQFIDDLLDSTVILILSRVGHSIRRGHRCVSSCTTELECVSGLLDVVVSRKKMRSLLMHVNYNKVNTALLSKSQYHVHTT